MPEEVPFGCGKKLIDELCGVQNCVRDVVRLRVEMFSEDAMFFIELYLPERASWKTPLPGPNTGAGRLKNAGCIISTVSGGSGASKKPYDVRPGIVDIDWCVALDMLELQGERTSEQRMRLLNGYLPRRAIWKSPSPVLNTGPGRLAAFLGGSGISATVSGG